ncbi:hypothetical protein [Synechococcus sp. UW179A]|uniref:hypothetical protein n=1 Tax=Synechococcus sp. UW179A TaxID=2575510 RepID=UPI001A7E06AC|nr:hypothetical protein [Synechococcus sp. UW179A]
MSCIIIMATLGLASGCDSSPKKIDDQSQVDEVPAKSAKVGEVLVATDDAQVVLTAPFRAGQPNGLYDGGVKIETPSAGTTHYEINAICSMPGLEGWPDYDNIYGKTISNPSDAGQEGGNTEWQLLLKFNGEDISKGKEKPPAWAKRLAQNLCRKGDFNDQNIEAKNS